jgi:hypothetical protein
MGYLDSFIAAIDSNIESFFSNNRSLAVGSFGIAQQTKNRSSGNIEYIPADGSASFPEISSFDIGTYHRVIRATSFDIQIDEGIGASPKYIVTDHMALIAFSDAIPNSNELLFELYNAIPWELPDNLALIGMDGGPNNYLISGEHSNYEVFENEFKGVEQFPFNTDRNALVKITYDLRFSFNQECYPNGCG